MTRDELRELARAAADQAVSDWHNGRAVYDDEFTLYSTIADAVLAAVEGAVTEALEEVKRVCDAYAEEMNRAEDGCEPPDVDVQESPADCAVGARECSSRIEPLARGAKS